MNVDNALFSLDFRAEERLAQLYVQVAGRSGRAEKQGEVVLQTHYPDHPLLTILLEKGYQAFAEETLKLRHNMGLPPFSFQALFKAQCRHSEEAENALSQLASFFYEQKNRRLASIGADSRTVQQKSGAISLAVAITARFSETITGGIKSIFARADKVFSSAVDFRRGSIWIELAKIP